MLASVISIIGLCFGIVLLSPMQEPVIDMAFAPAGVGARQGSMGALPRNAPVTGLNLRGLRNIPYVNAINPTAARWSAYRSPVVVRADSKLLQALDAEIQKARECTSTGTHEECLVAWDAVEELSAAVAHSDPKTADSQFPKLNDADMKTFKDAMAKFAAAREKAPPKDADRDTVPKETYETMAAALAKKQAVLGKIANVRLANLEDKIQTAKEEAKASGSAVDWDIVEELMQERSHLIKFDGSS
jgi:hypothetical protein